MHELGPDSVPDAIPEWMTAGAAAPPVEPPPNADRPTLIEPGRPGGWGSTVELVEVVKAYGGVRVLRGVSFAADPGALTVLVGPRGCGKTLIMRLVAGLERPDDGAVIVRGKDISRASGRRLRKLRERMSVMFQGAVPFGCGLFESVSAHENVAFPLRQHGRVPARRVDELAHEYLGRVGLAEHAAWRPDSFTASMRKRLALARALALQAPLVVLDDFASGLDDASVERVCDLVGEEHERQGGTYLLTATEPDVARRVGGGVVVLERGRIVREPAGGLPVDWESLVLGEGPERHG